MSVVIDIYNHFLPESWENLADRFGEPEDSHPWRERLPVLQPRF